MKLIRFSRDDSSPRFGIVIADRAVAFTSLQARSGVTRPDITFERLGTLRCRFAEPKAKLLPGRWPVRPSMQKYLA